MDYCINPTGYVKNLTCKPIKPLRFSAQFDYVFPNNQGDTFERVGSDKPRNKKKYIPLNSRQELGYEFANISEIIPLFSFKSIVEAIRSEFRYQQELKQRKKDNAAQRKTNQARKAD